MEPEGRPGMQGVFGLLLVVGGVVLVVLILKDLASVVASPAGPGLQGGIPGTQSAPQGPGILSDCSKYKATNKLANGFDCAWCNFWHSIWCSSNLNDPNCQNCSACSAWNIQCGH